MTSALEPCICPKCGHKTEYVIVTSTNSFMKDYMPTNKCPQCGHQLTVEDIDLNTCSPIYREGWRHSKIHEIYSSENKEVEEEYSFKCEKCGCTKTCGAGFSLDPLPEKYEDDEDVFLADIYDCCSECGHTQYRDLSFYLDGYHFLENGEEEGTFILKEKPEHKEKLKAAKEYKEQRLREIEQELITKGELPSQKFEAEYAKNYKGTGRQWRRLKFPLDNLDFINLKY